ncbi:OprD family porin [Pseudomonas capsici]|uniref:OprD family porin n=1 Tax=Pseudomonas capsici TaxID=2810614 RepID=UPI0021F21FA6|nr:OprD family porin [Pseudomonas capsici]MCV4342679.1 OprD family porin [Pseudomonas capsici]
MKTTSTALLALSLTSFGAVAQAEESSHTFIPTQLSTSSAQDDAKGFFEDQHLTGTTRNWYSNELRRRNNRFTYSNNGVETTTPRRINWAQGTIVNYSSGFTQGTIGFSTEVALYNAIALERDRSDLAGGANRTLTENDGDPVGQWSKLGLGNVKARISNTTFTAGRQSVNTPVIAFIGNRALPSSFQGFALQSDEFNNLSIQAGSFDRVSPRTEQSLSKFRSEYATNNANADRLSMVGADYKPFDNLTTSLYASDLEDLWKQYYFGFTHDIGDSKAVALSTNLNYYKTKDSGQSKLGPIDNDTYSLSFTATHQAHSFGIAYQEVMGNEYFDYAHETNAIFLANSLLSDFNGPNEKSLQLSYVINMADYGIPGLKFNAYQARGWGIDGTHYRGNAYTDVRQMNGEHHYEYGIGTTYAVQSGPLKATTVRATYTTHRASEFQSDGNINEFRLVTTIPFKIL